MVKTVCQGNPNPYDDDEDKDDDPKNFLPGSKTSSHTPSTLLTRNTPNHLWNPFDFRKTQTPTLSTRSTSYSTTTPFPRRRRRSNTLSMSIVEGALKGLTGEKTKQKAKWYTPPRTRSKTRGINTSQWLPFQ